MVAIPIKKFTSTASGQMYDSAMPSRARFRLLIPLATLLGCGVSSTPPTSSSPHLNLTGNWKFQASGAVAIGGFSTPVEELTGGLTTSGNAVTGVLRASPLAAPNCVAANTDLAASGSLDASGNLTLTFPIAGGVGSLSGNFTEITTRPLLYGTYQVVGGACAQSASTLTFFEVANVTGTYSGTTTQTFPVPIGTAPTSTVTAVLVQSDTPNADGQYPLTGTVTVTGACNSTLTFNQGVVFGDNVQSYPAPVAPFNPVPTNSFTSSAVPFSNQALLFGALYQLTGCGTAIYSAGVLTRQ